MTYTSVHCYDPRIGNRKSPVKFCGKSQGDIASLLNAPRGMFNQKTEAGGTYRTHRERHLHNLVNLWIWKMDSGKSKQFF